MKLLKTNGRAYKVEYLGVSIQLHNFLPYKYIATDANGTVVLFVTEPDISIIPKEDDLLNGEWAVSDYILDDGEEIEKDYAVAAYVDLGGIDWKTTCIPIDDLEIIQLGM